MGSFFLSEIKPIKAYSAWTGVGVGSLGVFSDNFKSILLNDKEPTLIEDIIKFSI